MCLRASCGPFCDWFALRILRYFEHFLSAEDMIVPGLDAFAVFTLLTSSWQCLGISQASPEDQVVAECYLTKRQRSLVVTSGQREQRCVFAPLRMLACHTFSILVLTILCSSYELVVAVHRIYSASTLFFSLTAIDPAFSSR